MHDEEYLINDWHTANDLVARKIWQKVSRKRLFQG
jgi:hypothetical protein